MRVAAISYSCRNMGQVALRWEWEKPPTGIGWIDVKAEPLVRLSDVEALRKAFQALYDETTRINNPQWFGSPMQQECAAALGVAYK